MEESNIEATECGRNSRTDQWPTTVFGSSVRCIGRVIIYLQSKGADETCPVGRPTCAWIIIHVLESAHLSQHFALNEK